MRQYLDLLQRVMNEGVDKGDRTRTGMRELFGAQMRFDLSNGFPLVTTKKMFLKGIIHELLWFLKGDTNIKYLNDNGVHIWDAWADEAGNLGPVYGSQWRRWTSTFARQSEMTDAWDVRTKSIDQIANLIEEIKTKPNSRRMIVTAWNPAEVDQMALPPCHCLFQFNVTPYTTDERVAIHKESLAPHISRDMYPDHVEPEDIEYVTKKLDEIGVPKGKLNCQLYQRSADMFLGVPFNIASYALLTMMVAQVCNLKPGTFIHTFGSAHVYYNHFDQVKEQLTREPLSLPHMEIDPDVKRIDDFKYEDFKLVSYEHHPAIKGKIAV